MTHQEATAVVAVPLAQVEERLKDITSWSAFLAGVQQVRQTAFQRYCFTLKAGKSGVREVDAAVVPHPREHRFSWRALSGPRVEGEIRLAPVDELYTRVSLSLTVDPAGFVAGLGDMLASSRSTATIDLQQLEAYVRGGMRTGVTPAEGP